MNTRTAGYGILGLLCTAITLLACSRGAVSREGSFAEHSLCQLAKYSDVIVEGDVTGWSGSRSLSLASGVRITKIPMKVLVVKTHKGSVPAVLDVFGPSNIDTSGHSDIGEVSNANGSPKRGIFFLAEVLPGNYVALADQGYFWLDTQGGVFKNNRGYQTGVGRGAVEAAIASYRNARVEGRLCPGQVLNAPSSDPIVSDPWDGGAAWQDGGP